MANYQFKVIESVTLPLPLPKWASRATFDFGLQRMLALPLASDKIRISQFERIDESAIEYSLPRDLEIIAVHPVNAQIATISGGALSICDRTGARIQTRNIEAGWGIPRCLAYNCDGDTLVLTTEASDKKHLGEQNIIALNADSLEYFAHATIRGDTDAGHSISVHPNEPLMALNIGCGQDGTWAILLSVDLNGISVRGSIGEDVEYAPLVSFSSNGDSVIGRTDSEIRMYRIPTAKVISVANAGHEKYFEFASGQWNGSVLAIVNDAESENREIRVYDIPNLAIKSTITMPTELVRSRIDSIGEGYFVSCTTNHKKRISPADCTPESQTFQLWKITER